MKKYLFVTFVILIMTGVASMGQTHRLWVGAGGFFQGGRLNEADPGTAISLQYGFEKSIGENWAIMPVVGYEELSEGFFRSAKDGEDLDNLCNVNVSLNAVYKLNSPGFVTSIGFGPQVSFDTKRERFFIDSNPADPMNKINKFKKNDIGIKAFVMFNTGSRFFWGVQTYIGLKNIRSSAMEGSARVRSVSLILGIKL